MENGLAIRRATLEMDTLYVKIWSVKISSILFKVKSGPMLAVAPEEDEMDRPTTSGLTRVRLRTFSGEKKGGGEQKRGRTKSGGSKVMSMQIEDDEVLVPLEGLGSSARERELMLRVCVYVLCMCVCVCVLCACARVCVCLCVCAQDEDDEVLVPRQRVRVCAGARVQYAPPLLLKDLDVHLCMTRVRRGAGPGGSSAAVGERPQS